jgi:hypothetical protein
MYLPCQGPHLQLVPGIILYRAGGRDLTGGSLTSGTPTYCRMGINTYCLSTAGANAMPKLCIPAHPESKPWQLLFAQ